MDQSFIKAISSRDRAGAMSLDSLLLFSKAEWIAFAGSRSTGFLLQWITVFLFGLWSIDCLANRQIDWQSGQYPVVFAVFSALFLVRGLGREHLIPHVVVSIVVFLNAFVIAGVLFSGPEVFSLLSRNLVFYASPVAIANSVVFKPRLGLAFNLLIVVCLSLAAAAALISSPTGMIDLHLVGRAVGVIGFQFWFMVAQYYALTLYVRHRLELVEVHHLVAEMERNQRLNEENSRIREDLIRTQRVQMVDSMTSTMAHEVNQPISCANNYIQAARRWLSRPDPDVAEALVSLGGAQDEIIRVSERVMSVRRLMQRLSSEFTSIALDELVAQLETMVRSDLAGQGITLTITGPDDPEDCVIYGCEEELTQVLLNLVANATDALASRPAGRLITLSLAPADLGEVALIVADNGCGIAAGDVGRVFDRLFSTKAGGSGLGLSLCKRIVSNHGGTIGIDSQPGQGTRVIMRFPRAELRHAGWG